MSYGKHSFIRTFIRLCHVENDKNLRIKDQAAVYHMLLNVEYMIYGNLFIFSGRII